MGAKTVINLCKLKALDSELNFIHEICFCLTNPVRDSFILLFTCYLKCPNKYFPCFPIYISLRVTWKYIVWVFMSIGLAFWYELVFFALFYTHFIRMIEIPIPRTLNYFFSGCIASDYSKALTRSLMWVLFNRKWRCMQMAARDMRFRRHLVSEPRTTLCMHTAAVRWRRVRCR